MSNLTALCTILPHWGHEGGGMGPETSHVLKHWARLACLFGAHIYQITNERIILYGQVRNDFDAGKSITWAIIRALNISTFLGPGMALTCCNFRAQKSIDVQGPSNGPRNGFARTKVITYVPYK